MFSYHICLFHHRQQIKNLRSQVSRAALCCLTDMFTCFGRQMDTVRLMFTAFFIFSFLVMFRHHFLFIFTDLILLTYSQDLEVLCKILLTKSGETSSFIRDDVDKALSYMVYNVTPTRALIAITSTGCGYVCLYQPHNINFNINTWIGRQCKRV
jgi:hypothetical protein